jgi:Immunity protein 53
MVVLTPLDWLMGWYKKQCNGDWEHTYGVQICTMDNPGWSLKIDLANTPLSGRELSRFRVACNYGHETEWWTCWTENNQFRGAGGPAQLGAMISKFRSWVAEVC